MKMKELLVICAMFHTANIAFAGESPNTTQTTKPTAVTRDSRGIITITGYQRPKQPQTPLPYQVRGTRMDMVPKITLEQPKTNQCKYTPSREDLKAYADNAEKLQGGLGPLFLGRQAQLNQDAEKRQKEAEAACKGGQKPPPNAITFVTPTR